MRVRKVMRWIAVVSSFVVGSAAGAWAGEGVLEINQVCAVQTGCFTGDAPGFPVTLPGAGSYRLTSSLEVTANGTNGIEVTTPETEVDLNGFQIRGPVACSDTGTGVDCIPSPTSGAGVQAAGVNEVTVRNGIVRGFNHGLRFGSQATVEDVILYSNADRGVLAGGRILVRDSIVSLNGGNGVDVDRTSQIVGVAAVRNNSAGLRGRAGATRMEQNLMWANYGPGLFCNSACTIRRNAAIDGGEDGIRTGEGTWVEGNLISNNARDGLAVGANSGFRHNVIEWNVGSQLGVTGAGVYVHPNLCEGGQDDATCRFVP